MNDKMTQKDKLLQAKIGFQRIKSKIELLDQEADRYDMKFHRSHVESIKSICDTLIGMIK